MTLPDGTPDWLPQVEKWLVGGAMLSSLEDVVTAFAECPPEMFRDKALGAVWAVMPFLDDCPCWVHVAEALAPDDLREIGGEPGLVELAYTQNAYLYAGRVGLEAHAVLVRKQGEIRRRLIELRDEGEAVLRGSVTSIPRVPAVGARDPFAA